MSTLLFNRRTTKEPTHTIDVEQRSKEPTHTIDVEQRSKELTHIG